MEVIFSLESVGSLATLAFLEVILGIDNIIFISIITNKLPKESRSKVWRLGLLLAFAVRVIMLFTISWVMNFNSPLLTIARFVFSLRDLILGAGGMFLIYKSTSEMSHDMLPNSETEMPKKNNSMLSTIFQIVFIDFVFSFDSVLTAVGLSNAVYIMISAVLLSMIIMMFFLNAIGEFIKRHPTIETLALAFLILIGFILVLESFHYEIPKGYIYSAIAFSFTIELLNIWKRRGNEERKLKLLEKSPKTAINKFDTESKIA